MSKPSPVTTYAQLVKMIQITITSGRALIQKAQAETYWKVGKFISDYILEGSDRAKYGEHIFENLSKDLNISVNNLERMARFSREFSISDARQKLTWTQFRMILALPDPLTRQQFIKETLSQKLTARQLQKEVKQRNALLHIPPDGPIPKLKFTRGQLYTYTVIEPPSLQEEDQKFIDCGFNLWYQIPKAQLGKFKDGEIIETVKIGYDKYQIKSSKRTAKDLYVFKAIIERIVDGDTALVQVNCGFGLWTRQYLRFRAINCPELTTKEGQSVKRFIEVRIKPNDFVIIKTHKDDKYGRYLVDVWYAPPVPPVIARSPADGGATKSFDNLRMVSIVEPQSQQEEWNVERVAREGIYLNQELLDNRLAVKWK